MQSLKGSHSKHKMSSDANRSHAKSDEVLLHLVGEQDQQAYEELFSRYIKRAYALARNLVRNKELAEEAAQEAMLAIWKSAPSFDQSLGPAQGWIFQIIANKSVQISRKEHLDRAREKSDKVPFSNSISASGQFLPELGQRELKDHLKVLVANLSLENKHLVTLYFGAGLSQDKIAEIISVPQRKVSTRLKKIIEQLKSGLAKGGFVTPVALSSLIQENLWSGWQIPTALPEKILERILSEAAGKPASISLKNKAVAICIMLLASLAAIMLTPALKSNAPVASISNSEPARNETFSSTRNIPQKQLWEKTWTFNSPHDTEGLTFFGTPPIYKPKGGLQHSGCLSFPSSAGKHGIQLTGRKLPLKISCQIRQSKAIEEQILQLSLVFASEQCKNVFAIFENISTCEKEIPTEWVQFTIYIQEHAMDTWLFPSSGTKPKRQGVTLLELQKEMTFGLDCAGNLSFEFDNLTVKEIAASDIPDVSEFVSAFEKRKENMKAGEVYAVPELKSFQNVSTPIQMKIFDRSETGQSLMNLRK